MVRRHLGLPPQAISGRPSGAGYVASLASSVLLLLIALALFSGTAYAQIALPDRIALTDGQRLAGTFTAFLQEGKLEFEIAGAKRVLAPSELIQFGGRREVTRGPCVFLTDGSIVVSRDNKIPEPYRWIGLSSGGVVVRVLSLGVPLNASDPLGPAELKLPLERVQAVVYQIPAGAKERDALFDQLAALKGDEDRLLLENGDVIAGTLQLPEEAEGPKANAAAGETFTIETRVGNRTQKVEVPVKRVAALRFSPALLQIPEQPKSTLELGMPDGSFLRTVSIGPIIDGGVTAVELPGGLKIPISRFCDLPTEVVYLRSRQERVTYLTDLAPAAFRHWPFLTTEWPLGRGRNVLGGRLRAGGFVEDQGLGMHSRSRAIYAVPPGVKRFEAEAALDDAAGAKGSVVFRVLKLSGQAWSVATETGPVRGGDPPVPLSVDVSGAEQIALVVEFGERGDECDWADWLGARFVK